MPLSHFHHQRHGAHAHCERFYASRQMVLRVGRTLAACVSAAWGGRAGRGDKRREEAIRAESFAERVRRHPKSSHLGQLRRTQSKGS